MMKYLQAYIAGAYLLALVTCTNAHGTGGDCRNQTWSSEGGTLDVMSWHIHYTTNETEFPRFYNAFIKEFRALFPPEVEGNKCPFGPNFGNFEDRPYPYICSLEDALEDGRGMSSALDEGDGPWTVAQRAFYVPNNHKDRAWAWSQREEIRGYLDVFLHANTGCMHDDHVSFDLRERKRSLVATHSGAVRTRASVGSFLCAGTAWYMGYVPREKESRYQDSELPLQLSRDGVQ